MVAFLHPSIRWRAEQDQVNMTEDCRKLEMKVLALPPTKPAENVLSAATIVLKNMSVFHLLGFISFFFLMRQQKLPQWTHTASTKHSTDTLKSFHLHWAELCWQAAGTLWSGLSGYTSSVVRKGDYHTCENTQNSFNLPLLGTRSHDSGHPVLKSEQQE